MRPYRNHLIVLVVAVCFLFALPALTLGAQGPEQVGEYGYIDWEKMQVRATGVGIAGPNAQNAAHAKMLAKGAAKVVAQRNLLEVIKGVRIDSQTTVNNAMIQDDTIVTRVKGMIKGAGIDHYDFDASGACTATVSMPLTGELSQTLLGNLASPESRLSEAKMLPSGSSFSMESKLARLEERVAALERQINSLQRIRLEQEELSRLFIQLVTLLTENQGFDVQPVAFTTSGKIKELQENQSRILARLATISKRLTTLEGADKGGQKTKPEASPVQAGNKAGYTGLVIDARGIGFRPCLRPRVFGQSKLLYPGSYVDRHLAIRQGYVRFYRNLGQAQQSSLVGKMPFTVKAASLTRGKRALLLPDAASQELFAVLQDSGNFMSRCKVVIVF